MASNAAARQRLHRERCAAGRLVIRLELDEAITAALAAADLIAAHQLEDRAALARAIRILLAAWAEKITT